MMSVQEIPLVFDCAGVSLLGILHQPDVPAEKAVLIVVGGPQYRVGSHRQFVLLARFLAARGVAVLRVDYRAMGDSGGDGITFEGVDDDLRAAVDLLCMHVPSAQELVIWGLCDAASAALFYAYQDSRVKGLVLLNPWLRTEAGEARAYLKHYYLKRIVSRDFWRKVFSGKWNVSSSARSLLQMVRSVLKRGGGTAPGEHDQCGAVAIAQDLPLPERMAAGLKCFNGRVLIILSGQDYVADEFRDLVAESEVWRHLLARDCVEQRELAQANHTFSKAEWRDQVALWSWEWLSGTHT